jgi:hypothetical protein
MIGSFLNDQGVKQDLEILEMYEYSDKKYALVQFEEEGEAFIFLVQEHDEELILEQIDTESEYQEVRDIILMDLDS